MLCIFQREQGPNCWSEPDNEMLLCEFYNKNKKTTNPRTSSSLQHKWFNIQKDTLKFCGFYAEIKRRNQSEKSEDDKVNFVTTTLLYSVRVRLTLYNIFSD
jgi:hypothetical protein